MRKQAVAVAAASVDVNALAKKEIEDKRRAEAQAAQERKAAEAKAVDEKAEREANREDIARRQKEAEDKRKAQARALESSAAGKKEEAKAGRMADKDKAGGLMASKAPKWGGQHTSLHATRYTL